MLERHSVQVFLPLDISARSNGLKFSGITSATPLSTLGKNCKLQGEQCIKPVSNNYFENKSLVAISNSGVSTIGLNTEGYIKASSEENKFKKSKCSGLHHGLAETKVTSLNLFDLPPEILDLIFSFLDQKTLVNVLYVSQKGRNSAIPILYRRPYFTTTYRLAQFVTTVSSNMEFASLVRILDLSNLTTPFDASNRPLASWRDWKLRTEPLYKMRESEAVSQNTKVDHRSKSDLIIKANRKTARRSKNIISSSSCFKSYHPLQSPLLKQFASIKDVPTGYLLHILYCCKGIVGINLSNLPLAIDYRVESLKYKSIYLDKQQFVSDLPKSYFEPYEVSALSVMDLFKAMVMLENLQILTIINVTWVTREVIGEFLRDSAAIHTQSLKSIDLQKSGMARNLPWAILGTPADIQCALKF